VASPSPLHFSMDGWAGISFFLSLTFRVETCPLERENARPALGVRDGGAVVERWVVLVPGAGARIDTGGWMGACGALRGGSVGEQWRLTLLRALPIEYCLLADATSTYRFDQTAPVSLRDDSSCAC
jgi:hypothetical protein